MAMRIECSTCGRVEFSTGDVGPALRGWVIKRDRKVCPKCATYEPSSDDDDESDAHFEGELA